MVRYLLLIIFALWMGWLQRDVPTAHSDAGRVALFFAGMALIVLFMALWCRVMIRHISDRGFDKKLSRFHRYLGYARGLVIAWYAFGLFQLDWGNFVITHLGRLAAWPVVLPGVVLGTWPAIAAWMALWWAQFPAERGLREQNALIELDDGLPVHAPPGFLRYFTANVRMQVLFTVAPVILVLALRDAAALALWSAGFVKAARGWSESSLPGAWDTVIQLTSVGAAFAFAPEILRRVLHTQPLPSGPLRRRLEEMCRRSNLKYRDILLWKTDNNMGNAAVMGILPQMRYILLSDLLLETMSDEQIEAVFAHELGHVVHRHMLWFIVFAIAYSVVAWGAEVGLELGLRKFNPKVLEAPWFDTATAFPALGFLFFLFFALSRRFERQADVYAARTIQMNEGPVVGQLATASASHLRADTTRISPRVELEPASYVGQYGASLFGSALHRVATINGIPPKAFNLSHGSISSRVNYLQELSGDPARTGKFDRTMGSIYACIVAVMAMGALAAVVSYLKYGAGVFG